MIALLLYYYFINKLLIWAQTGINFNETFVLINLQRNFSVVWKEIFIWYNAAMTEKSTQILKIFSIIVIDTNYLLLSSSSVLVDEIGFKWGSPYKLFWSETSESLKKNLKLKSHFFYRHLAFLNTILLFGFIYVFFLSIVSFHLHLTLQIWLISYFNQPMLCYYVWEFPSKTFEIL